MHSITFDELQQGFLVLGDRGCTHGLQLRLGAPAQGGNQLVRSSAQALHSAVDSCSILGCNEGFEGGDLTLHRLVCWSELSWGYAD